MPNISANHVSSPTDQTRDEEDSKSSEHNLSNGDDQQSEIPSAVQSRSMEEDPPLHWTVATVFQSIAAFVLSGLAEIGGGWLVWQTIREGKPAWWAVLGSLSLVAYGFIPPTLQPPIADSFGRIYAVYGGFFILLSFLWGWALDGQRPDHGDLVGGSIAMVGVLLVLFWPR